MPAELVFVYGSLREGASNHLRMQDWNRVSLGVVRGRLVKIGCFPALVLDPDAVTWVWGDIFRVEGHQLRTLLEYEGLSATEERDYRLAETEASSYVGGGSSWNVQLWAWAGPVDQAVPVPSGDWLDVECPRPAPLFTWSQRPVCLRCLPSCFPVWALAAASATWWKRFCYSVACCHRSPGWSRYIGRAAAAKEESCFVFG